MTTMTAGALIETETRLGPEAGNIDAMPAALLPRQTLIRGDQREEAECHHLFRQREGTGEVVDELGESEEEWVTSVTKEGLREEYTIVPERVFAGFIVFGAGFLFSTVAHISALLGAPVLLSPPLSFFAMIGSGALLGTAIVGLWEAVRTGSN